MKFIKKHITRLWAFLRNSNKKINKFYKNNKRKIGDIIYIVTICVILLLVVIFFSSSVYSFFKEDVIPMGELIEVACIVIGAAILLWGLRINNKKVKEQTRQNEISEKAQINTRFKDASILLGSADTSSQLAGIYALHQIAEDIHKDADQRGFLEVIHNVLCAFVRENFSKKRETKAKAGFTMLASKNETPQYEPITTPPIILQTIIDVLFKNEGNIYARFRSDLSNCLIENVDFCVATLSNVDFKHATLSNVKFVGTRLENVAFAGARLENVEFTGMELENVRFTGMELENVRFTGMELENVRFVGTRLSNVRFSLSKLSDVEFPHSILSDVDFSITQFRGDINFEGTKLQYYSLEEIAKPGRSRELTKSKEKT